ncbi:MAG: hypothetical protein J5824_06195, partial [Lachnospiraceae bacterium]|nr:hypothetical protein [Lachnospiraceae bacterium]
IDTIFVGNSAGEMMNADEFSDLTGTHAFNMCTPSQSLSVSLKNIKMAYSHHKIKNAVMMITLDSVNAEEYDGIDHLYDRVVNSSSPLHVRIIKTVQRDFENSFSFDNIDTERSITVWIPWTNETIHGFSNITGNLKKRISRFMSGDRLGSHIAFDLNSTIYETANGYMTDDDISMLREDAEAAKDLLIPSGMISSDKLTMLARICRFCKDNGIELKIIVTPHRSDYYERYESFREDSRIISTFLDDFVSKREVMYYNTEDDEKLHTTLPDDYFYDWEHITDDHKNEATAYLADIISSKMLRSLN